MRDWLKAYSEAVGYARAHIPKSATFAFNTNVDLICCADSALERLELPGEMLPLLEAMRRGESGEERVARRMAEFIRGHFHFRERRMGGQAGNAANAAARLGVRAVAHAANLTGMQQMLFEHGVKAIGEVSAESSVHYVFEFSGGQELFGFSVPESGRFIFTHDPANEEMRISTEFKRFTLKHAREIDCALVSGFHNLREEGCRHKLDEIAALLRMWKKLNPKMRIHAELGDFSSGKVLGFFARGILSRVDSVGMNELELRDLASVLGIRGKEEFAVAAEVFARLPRGLGEMAVHEKAYSFAFSRKTGRKELERRLLFAHALAAFKAAKGRNAGFIELEHFLSQKQFVCADGIAALKRFGETKLKNAALVPALAVEPKYTVGLGDAYATGWLLMSS